MIRHHLRFPPRPLPLAALVAIIAASARVQVSGFAIPAIAPAIAAAAKSSRAASAVVVPPVGRLASSSWKDDVDVDVNRRNIAIPDVGNSMTVLPTPPASYALPVVSSLILMTTFFLVPAAHAAAGPDWGLFEGRSGSLLHPIAMLSMFGLSASTALLGYQWRRQRTIGDEISTLRKGMPKLPDGVDAIDRAIVVAMDAEVVDMAYVNSLRAASEIEAKIADLTTERKGLASANPRDRHFNQGALLLFVGTAFAIEGPLNTYARAGKLFPGPHLYAGAGLVVLWSLAAAMVPYMQKGNDAARAVHVGANVAGIGLFAWQVTTGLPILFKVIELTKWP